MPNTREKLIELLNAVDGVCPKDASCYDCEYKGVEHCAIPAKADYLIANGVTFQNRDIHWATERAYKNGCEAGKPKWIPVTERLPDEEHEGVVLVYSGDVEPAIVCGDGFLEYDKYEGWEIDKVTHWMPLPEPPKGE